LAKKKTTQRKKAAARRAATKETYTFPKAPLEKCVRLAQAIEEKNAGKPIPAADLPKLVGYNKSSDWRFLDLLRASNMFGLVDGVGEQATVSLTDLAQDIVAPSSATQRRDALIRSFNSVDAFKNVSEYYKDKHLPDDEYFANTLVREFDIPRERVTKFIETFTDSLQYLRSFATSPATVEAKPLPTSADANVKVPAAATVSVSPDESFPANRQREFLDTCFVLMPFGNWYDIYYKDVYAPAIKGAGLEPVRADDLFHSGSVVEQIWEQIQEAKVLVAEVTGKNANVFYELGLSHACGKPVVILTGCLEDVPFDLRHLRIVVYDVSDPQWANKVKSSLATHLKNAKADPSRSLPQPFRDLVAAGDGEDDSDPGVDLPVVKPAEREDKVEI